VANTVDLDRHVYELPGLEALPGAVRAQPQGRALLGPVFDRDHLGATLAGDEQRVDLLQV